MVSFENHPLAVGDGVPHFIAAGVLKEPRQLEPFIQTEYPHLMPLVTLGTFTWPVSPGNASAEHPVDFVYDDDLQQAGNAKGLPGGGVEAMRALRPSIRSLEEIGVKTVVSVTNLPNERAKDIIPNLVEEAAALGSTAVEVNLSCPNGLKDDGSLHEPVCNNADASAEVVSLSRERVGPDFCLGVKDSPHVTSPRGKVDTRAVGRLLVVLNPLIDFITGINTIGNQPFPQITSTGGRGGMSGPVVAPIAHQWLRVARAHAAPHVALLSCGGVDSDNLAVEWPLRKAEGAWRIGGAQEFYRKEQAYQVALTWARRLGAK